MAQRTSEQIAAAVRDQLQRIVNSPGFLHSERLRRFLTHCVDATLTGRLEDLKEYTIGRSAFDRPKHYNPAEDPIVRVEARRLRKKLEEYYQTHTGDPVVIELPKGGYLPIFEFRPERVARNPKLAWFAIGAVLCGLAAAAIWLVERRPVPANLVLTRITFDQGLSTDPTLSPDGTLLAYASDRANTGGLDIWIQPLLDSDPRQLTNDPADDSQPAISPDRATVAFRSERQPPGVYLAPATGGQARLLAPDGRNPQFSPNGRQIAYWVGAPGSGSLLPAGKTFLVSSSGGSPRPLLPDFLFAVCPVWSSDSRWVLVEAAQADGEMADWWVVAANGDHATRTGLAKVLEQSRMKLSAGECGVAWQNDALVFSASHGDTQNLWRTGISSDGQVTGTPARITFGSADEVRPAAASSTAIAFASRSQLSNIWSLSLRQPDQLVRITYGSPESGFPSSAGRRIAFISNKHGRPVISVKDLETGGEITLTQAPAESRYPQLCAGGETVLFSEGPNAFAAPVRSPSPRLFCDGCARVWQCNQHEVFYLPAGAKNPLPIYQLLLPGRTKLPLLASSRHDLANAQKSADGWVVFHAIVGPARRQIFVARYSPGQAIPEQAWIPITGGAQLDRSAVWNDRSDTLYFLSERCGFRCIWSQRIDSVNKKPIGPATAVRHFHSARQSLSGFGDVGAIGLSYNAGSLYFALGEQSGNVWLGRSEHSAK
jgi:eukaryotic-like serine/threonine-protein kinase